MHVIIVNGAKYSRKIHSYILFTTTFGMHEPQETTVPCLCLQLMGLLDIIKITMSSLHSCCSQLATGCHLKYFLMDTVSCYVSDNRLQPPLFGCEEF